jgi:thioredoxin reductase/NAD-dependent dihydropyrimidine dehydrogenase PreA subunit
MDIKKKIMICGVVMVLTVVLVETISSSGIYLEAGDVATGIGSTSPLMWLYIVPLFLIWAFYIGLKVDKGQKNREIQRASYEKGFKEPVTLHPVIDHNRCIGCGSCVNACPEQDEHAVLGIIDGKCHLIGPSNCIGHGSCAEACPMDGISLVFGTKERGVDIPVVSKDFETNVPGLFIAGELGGMGLIRNAIEQGRQAMDSISNLDGLGKSDLLDVVIIGAGPAGFSASLAAMQKNLSFVTIEQETLGGTVSHYPRGKIVMTQPAYMPFAGKVKFKETTKEELLRFWCDIEKKSGLKINYNERVEAIKRKKDHFEVNTTKTIYKSKAVLLAIGIRGTPRKLGLPGEELPKVVYRVIEPEQYQGQHVLVVGGGDSALEAACCLSEVPDTKVTLSYRSEAFSRAKEKNRTKVEACQSSGSLKVLMKSNVKKIVESKVHIEHDGKLMELDNTSVIICAGGLLPTSFLNKIGITMETKYGTA